MLTDIPTRAELEQLLAVRDPACVSIYGVVDEIARRGPAAAILRYPV